MSTRLFLIVSITCFLSSCSVFGIRNWEMPKYTIQLAENEYEVRRYEPYLIAQTRVRGDTFREATSKGFRRVADYIFGKNYVRGSYLRDRENIEMTSPVLVEESQIIDMTAPVNVEKGKKNEWQISFVLPSKWKVETVPIPKDQRVIIQRIPEERIVSYEFTGFVNEEKIENYQKKLKEWAKKKNIDTKENVRTAIYDPQWSIPFLRRNEIHLFVEK